MALHVVQGSYRHYDIPGAYIALTVGEDETVLVPLRAT